MRSRERVRCARCGRVGWATGVGTVLYPRQHNGPDGVDCKGDLYPGAFVRPDAPAPEAVFHRGLRLALDKDGVVSP